MWRLGRDLGLGGQATGPEGAEGLLRPWVMRRLLRSRRWASYEFLSLPWQRHRVPPSRMFVRAGAPNPLVPPLLFSSHTLTLFFFFNSLILFPSRLCPQQTTESSPKIKKTCNGKHDDDFFWVLMFR